MINPRFLSGLLFGVALGLSVASATQPQTDNRNGWTCHTDIECEQEAIRRGITTD